MGAPVRRSFVMRTDGANSPLEELMRAARGGAGGGRGGRTRLALLLSLWWVNAKPPYDSTRPTSWWAELIGIDDPVRGSRNIAANLKELARRGFIDITAGSPGMPNTLTLLDDRSRERGPYLRPDGTSGAFFRIPEELWTTGAISTLSGPGLVMYLMMLYYHRRPESAQYTPGVGSRVVAAAPVWFSPNSFRQRHGLSEDTRLAGIRDLQNAGIVHIDNVPVDTSGPAGHRRFRRQMLTLNPQFTPPLSGVAQTRTTRRRAAAESRTD